MSRMHETAAAAVTAAAMLGGHEAQAVPQPEQPAQVEVAQQAKTLSLPQSVLGGPDIIERSSVNNGVETTTMDITDTSPWAPQFSKSLEGQAPQTANDRKVFTFGVDKLKSEGKYIDDISFQGFASDEARDRQIDQASAGLGITDPENVELADARAHAVGAEDQQIINDMTDQNVPATYKPGIEVDRSDLAAKEAELARQLRMTPSELMQRFNTDPASLPAEVQSTLEPLVGDRRVVAEITATRQLPTAGPERPGDSGKPTPTSHDIPVIPAPGTPDTSAPQPTAGQQTEPSHPHHSVDQPMLIAEDSPIIADTPITDVLPPATGPAGYGNSGQAITPYKGIAGPQHMASTSYAYSHKQPRPYNYSGKSGLRGARSHGGNRG